jgi:hypothetical protein
MAHKGLIRIKRLKRSLREIWVNRMKRMMQVTSKEMRNLFKRMPPFLIDDYSKTW